MQPLLIIADTLRNIEIEEELVTFLCSVIALFIFISFRNGKIKKSGKLFKHVEINAGEDNANECDAGAHNDKYYVNMDKAFQTAFENEDYWQALKCWRQLKHFNQSSIHLPIIIRAMRFCNKGAYFIVTELKDFFKAHPQECSIGFINDLLEPLARRSEDVQIVDLLVRMIPSINLTKDSRTYEIMLTMRAANGNFAKMQEVMGEMKIQDIAFTPRATVAVMTMGLQMGNADVVLKAFMKLKASWDERDTWSVSMFALTCHKANVLMQVVTLACQKGKVCELAAALEGMTIPEKVLGALQSKLSLLEDTELAASIAVLENSGRSIKADPIYTTLIGCSNSRLLLKSLPPWTAPTSKVADLNSSTSEGLSSDSEQVVERWSSESSSCSMSKSLAPLKVKKFEHAGSSASTSEGSRSDSEEELSFGHCMRAPPGLAPPPGF